MIAAQTDVIMAAFALGWPLRNRRTPAAVRRAAGSWSCQSPMAVTSIGRAGSTVGT